MNTTEIKPAMELEKKAKIKKRYENMSRQAQNEENVFHGHIK